MELEIAMAKFLGKKLMHHLFDCEQSKGENLDIPEEWDINRIIDQLKDLAVGGEIQLISTLDGLIAHAEHTVKQRKKGKNIILKCLKIAKNSKK